MEQEQEKSKPVVQAAKDYTNLMVGFDVENADKELKLIKAYCQQYRGEVIEIKRTTLFSAAVCAIPKDVSKEFKMKLTSHLDQLRAKVKDEEQTSGTRKTGAGVQWTS